MAERSDSAILKEMHEDYDYAEKVWREVREEGRKDMKYISGDPWDAKERQARKDANRPIISTDELSQYINQVINDVRQQKRGVKVNPKGSGANDKTAEFRENLIRGIEYESNAQSAYVAGFEGSLQRSYGFWRVTTQFRDDSSFDQDIRIKRIPNPDTVLIDPDFKEADTSDKDFTFVTDIMRKAAFKAKYPKATIQDFTPQMMAEHPKWIQDDSIRIAEYWKVKTTTKKLLLIEDAEQPIKIYEDELPKGWNGKILKSRNVETREVCQYITNGVEILEKNKWAGKWIPIVCVLGKEMYVDDGSGAKRVLMSLIRLARDPYMLYCYYRTCQAEIVGMTPKTPYIGYEGQFATTTDWANINQVPTAYAEVKAYGPNGEVLPIPQRQLYEPPIQALEMGAEAARRAIQAAMGSTPLPTAAQRQNEKSGEALKKISQEQSQGSYHFIDNLDRAMQFNGRIIDDLLKPVIDTAREMGIRKADESHEVIRVNDPDYENPETKEKQHLRTDEGDHDVTISTGPSFESQRQEVNDFLNTIISNIEALPIDPAIKSKFMALLIRMKNLGPLGDEMVQLLDPEDPDPNVMQGQLQKLQQQLKAIDAFAQEQHAQVQKLQQEKQAKVVDNEYRMALEKMKIEAQITVAEITTKAQESMVRLKMENDMYKQLHGDAHDLGLQKDQQAHEAEQLAAQQAAAAQSQVADQAHQQEMAAQQPEAGV